jgi:hypothetical protein
MFFSEKGISRAFGAFRDLENVVDVNSQGTKLQL